MTLRITGFAVVAAAGLAASLAAQNPASTTPSAAVMNDKTHEVTVTGCVAKDDDGKFMLTGAAIEPIKSPTKSPTKSLMNTGMTWMLSGAASLEPHLGHKVQLVGRTTWDASKPAPAAAETTTIVIRPVMDVRTVKMLSATCP